MEQFGNPKGVDEKVAMHPSERAARTDDLRKRLTGFRLSKQSLPSNALIDKFATILSKGYVRYVPWEKCTSREQELLEEPEIKGLRISESGGMLVQDIAPETTTQAARRLQVRRDQSANGSCQSSC